MVPDRDRCGCRRQPKTYTFTAGDPGTYLYEAGLLANGPAPGRPWACTAPSSSAPPARPVRPTPTPDTAFDDDAVLVLSEIDPALNNAANPAAFDMRKFAPRYFLINGKALPGHRRRSPAPPATDVLLRYVNAGMQYHSMAVLGAGQTVIALDGSPLGFARSYVAETFGPGQTADAIVTVPRAVRRTPAGRSTTAACCCTTATSPAPAGMLDLDRGPRTRRAGDDDRAR